MRRRQKKKICKTHGRHIYRRATVRRLSPSLERDDPGPMGYSRVSTPRHKVDASAGRGGLPDGGDG